ncbi:MAG: hypothetical protein LC118_10130 [Dehalococcoidia bacterium]|nr:hypothetical protein [Dehalococcoidia bacterium]
MTQLRINVDEPGMDLEQALASAAAGDEVLLERGGCVVARLRVEVPWARGSLQRFLELRATREPVDDEFAADLERIRKEMNTPVELRFWAS